jgi:hypothetical protein
VTRFEAVYEELCGRDVRGAGCGWEEEYAFDVSCFSWGNGPWEVDGGTYPVASMFLVGE